MNKKDTFVIRKHQLDRCQGAHEFSITQYNQAYEEYQALVRDRVDLNDRLMLAAKRLLKAEQRKFKTENEWADLHLRYIRQQNQNEKIIIPESGMPKE